jgi:hypothetical protein
MLGEKVVMLMLYGFVGLMMPAMLGVLMGRYVHMAVRVLFVIPWVYFVAELVIHQSHVFYQFWWAMVCYAGGVLGGAMWRRVKLGREAGRWNDLDWMALLLAAALHLFAYRPAMA